jgi:peptidoglycan/LPS O-acetylase OafA/YrhL
MGSTVATKRADRIHIVDALRGFAALYVLLFHFTQGNFDFLSGGRLHALGHYGWAGVDVFFVISGFIIPYSMYRSGYRLKNFLRFVLRRIVRLDPPYLVSVVMVVALGYISAHSPGYMGSEFVISWRRLLLHIGYLPGILGIPWYGVVYWTLALELQFYLLIGLLFPLLVNPRRWIGDLVVGGLAIASLLSSNHAIIFMWLGPFVLGIVAFRYKAHHIPLGSAAWQAAIALPGLWQLGAAPTILACMAALLIAFSRIRSFAIVEFFGAISYSLYLVHVPIGGRVINLATRFELNQWGTLLAVCMAFGISVAAAYLLWRFVEVPALAWSHRFSLRSSPQQLTS